ncbi:MAG: SpoIIE family protein phosphatase [Bacteroidia bacterium]|nr:SpoIIE family protein phosphatase [Bacteroidia bacterium]
MNKDIWLQTTLTPILDNGEVKKLIALDTDITEIKEAEEEIKIQKEKLEAERLKVNEKNRKLWELSIAIHKEKENMEKITKILEDKNRNIQDSITYAKKIQEAILPKISYIKDVLPDSFVLFKPRDIVSGDFYWFTDRYKFCMIAAADCTGHGVPGAFMSMIGNNLLNNIINENKIYKPADILNELDKNIIASLNQDISSSSKDGMDIALCSIELRIQKLTFAGANRPLLIVRKEDHAVEVIKGDQFPIGGHYSAKKIFNTDQFGGAKNKKFTIKRLQMVLLEIKNLPMHRQKEALDRLIENWKGKDEQIDDILMIGIRL